MIGDLVNLATYSMVGSGGDIGNFLFRLDQMGVFAFLLPFLLIFGTCLWSFNKSSGTWK
jgi:hypothetical protein